jgi:hypothetical protein
MLRAEVLIRQRDEGLTVDKPGIWVLQSLKRTHFFRQATPFPNISGTVSAELQPWLSHSPPPALAASQVAPHCGRSHPGHRPAECRPGTAASRAFLVAHPLSVTVVKSQLIPGSRNASLCWWLDDSLGGSRGGSLAWGGLYMYLGWPSVSV